VIRLVYCTHCGALIAKDAQVCQDCGGKQEPTEASKRLVVVLPGPQPDADHDVKNAKRNRIPMVRWRGASTVLILAGALLIAAFVLTRGHSSPPGAPPGHMPPSSTSPDSAMLLSPATRKRWLTDTEQTLAVAHAHPRRVATFATFLAATPSTVTVRTLPIFEPPGSSAQVYYTYSTVPRTMTFNLSPQTLIHLPSRGLAGLRVGTPLLIAGSRATAPGKLAVELITGLENLAHGSAEPTIHVLTSNEEPAHSQVQLASDVVSGSPDTPPTNGILMRNRVGFPGADWRAAIHLGNEGGCPYLGAGIEAKAGLGAEWHWPFAFRVDQATDSLAAQGESLPEAPPFSLGLSDPGAEDSYFFSAGFAAGLTIEVSCHFGPFGGSFTLADIGIKGLLANETTQRAPIAGEPDLTVPATDCLTYGVDPLHNIPSWVPFASKLAEYAELSISACGHLRLSGGIFRALLHGTGNSAGATPQGVALRTPSDSMIANSLTRGGAIRLDSINYQPLLHIGITAGVQGGVDAGKALALGDKLQQALKHAPPKVGSAVTQVRSAVASANNACEKTDEAQLVSCEIAKLSANATAHVTFDWPHPLEMVSPTILGQPVLLTVNPSAEAQALTRGHSAAVPKSHNAAPKLPNASCPGVACGSTSGVTVAITSVKRSALNNYGEELKSQGKFFVRMGVRIINEGSQTITIDNYHFLLLDSKHIVDSTSEEGYGSKCGLTGNGDPGLALSTGADVTMPESLCFEPHGSVNSAFTVALELDGGGEVDIPVG
jgi:RNA polymerase subunit RPABC4/transcription elongation factor Spt4